MDGTNIRPDGLVVVTYGKSTWAALIEVKTGTDQLTSTQINNYWDVARQEGYDHVITISNEIAPNADAHPTSGLKVRSNSTVGVSHISWTALLTTAMTIKQHAGVEDPEQAWLLAELIRYLEHSASGVLDFDDMGEHWTTVREAVRNVGTTPTDDGIDDICARWDQLLRYGALTLGANLGRDVSLVLTRKHQDPRVRQSDLMDELAADGTLRGTLRVPDTAGDMEICTDLRARQLVVTAEIAAPQDKGHRGRVGWLLRQLTEAPTQTIIEAFPQYARSPHTASLESAREDRDLLCPDGKEPHKFRVSMRAEMGMNKTGGGKRAGFVESVLGLVNTYDEQVLQQITPWQPSAPKTKKVVVEVEPDDGAGEAIRQAPAPVLIDS